MILPLLISLVLILKSTCLDNKYDFLETRNYRIPLNSYPKRFYVDKNTASCKSFVYRGAGGTNFNNFASLEECNKEFQYDYSSRVDVCDASETLDDDLTEDQKNNFNVCKKQQVDRYYFKKAKSEPSKSPACTKYDYNGCNEPLYSFQTENACKGMCMTNIDGFAVPNKVDCEIGPILTKYLPDDVDIKIVRDKEKSTCVHAVVDKSSTRGVFTTFKKCQQICHNDEKSDSRCKSTPYQPKMEGHITTKYYFNSVTNLCAQMMAVESNVDSAKNYFDTAGECISACAAKNDSDADEDLTDIPNVCSEPKEVGNGNNESTIPRWYYDKVDKVCRRFGFTGIGGNFNNFESESLCQYICIEGVNEVNLTSTTTNVDHTKEAAKTEVTNTEQTAQGTNPTNAVGKQTADGASGTGDTDKVQAGNPSV